MMWNKLISSFCFVFLTCSQQIAMENEGDQINCIVDKYNLEKFNEILNLPVIHATRIFPKDGKMIPGKSAKQDYEELNIRKGDPLEGTLLSPIGWRPTLHWAIAKLADDIDENTLSDRPYAIVTTLRNLLPQLIGVSTEDTFILGDFKVPDGSFVIMKESLKKDSSEETWLQRMIILDFPSERAILEKITQVINSNFSGSKNTLKKLIKDRNLLKNFSESIPCVFFGKHSCHQTQVLEKIIPYLCLKSYGDFSNDIVKDICIQSEELNKEIINSYRKNLLDSRTEDMAKIFTQQTVKRLLSIINLSKVEIYSPENVYKYYIGDNSSKNMKSHKNDFAQWFMKGKYLSDPLYSSFNISPIKVNNETAAKKEMILANLNSWYRQ